MSDARQLPARDYFALKAATRDLVTAAGRGPRAAIATRVRQQQLSEYGQPEHKLFMPIDVVADLEAEAGPLLTRELAALSNHLLVPVPQVARGNSALGRITAGAMKETSDVFVALGEALGDGELCADDAARVVREIDEALAKLVVLKLQVQAEAGT